MEFLTGERQKKYSIERLRCLYGDLLRCIDYENHHDIAHDIRHHEAETSPRFGLGRKVFWLATKDCENEKVEKKEQQRRDLSSAFLTLAATKSVVHELQQVVVARDEATVVALEMAKSLEKSVILLIRSIGEVVVNAEGRQPTDATKQDLRSDEAFEYFCEKAILALFVDIACETPNKGGTQSIFHGVVWSPHVKAQIFHTISLLVAGVRDSSAMYYLLSQNGINKLVAGMLPLQQWTDPALETMLPAYVEMVKTLALQLSDSPSLYPFFTVEEKDRIHFPLFSATLQTGTSSFAQSNSFVHATCLNLIVDVMHISYPPIQDWLHEAEAEQAALADHLCSLMLRRYTRLVHLTSGPVVDNVRSTAIKGQLKGLNDQIELLNDVFSCPMRGLQVRLCEQLLRQVLSVLWQSCGSSQRPFLSFVGVSDSDVIPATEGAAQAAMVVLTRVAAKLRYQPALRMLGVALWHAQASPLWTCIEEDENTTTEDDYAYTKALHQVVKGETTDSVPNMFQAEFYKALRGDYGEWRFVGAVVLIYQCLQSLDSETLMLLGIIPKGNETTALEDAVSEFLKRKHTRNSSVSVSALECATSLVVEWVHCVARNTNDVRATVKRLDKSPMLASVRQARDFFFRLSCESDEIVGVSDLFVDIVESMVVCDYKKITLAVNGIRSGPRILAYNLGQAGCAQRVNSAEVLVRKLRGIKTNEVELTRFHVHMAIHFRAIIRVLSSFLDRVSRSKPEFVRELMPDLIDRADQLTSIFGGLREKPQVGTDIDTRGRMTFPFFVDGNIPDKRKVNTDFLQERERAFSDDMIFLRSASTLVVVLDPIYLFVVKPLDNQENARGTIICCVPLLNVIAAATDGDWLHVAVRHDDVGFLIKGGNMALRFSAPGTALIVRQFIDRSRQVLRGELVRKIKHLFAVAENDVPKEPAANSTITNKVDEAIKVEDNAEVGEVSA
eukprot:scaffold1564_cov174-Amphora_coffeaeformis.AAC.14